ncbi:DUF6266 family protein [Olivibacter sitiensis]|uniref:DUF6266 family protein n=1 Tax=Olivibacter sitiensis TaxID=376470 RepID=UPI000414C236|nr:DUF6266 family protein [Olivibacter sitiensis]
MLLISSKIARKKDDIDGRIIVRERFALANRYLGPMRKIIGRGFGYRLNKVQAFAKAVQILLDGGIQGQYPQLWVDPARVTLSSGTLPPVYHLDVRRKDDRITVDFIPHRGIYGNADDGVVLCAHNAAIRIAGINEQKACREDGKVQLTLPPQLRDKEVDLYIFAHCRQYKKFSNSHYLGRYPSRNIP